MYYSKNTFLILNRHPAQIQLSLEGALAEGSVEGFEGGKGGGGVGFEEEGFLDECGELKVKESLVPVEWPHIHFDLKDNQAS